MNLKTIVLVRVFLLLAINQAVAQKASTISTKELCSITGCWQGTLNYSGTIIRKPYTTTAELVVRQIGKSGKFEFLHIYTKDPNDNKRDTLIISDDGTKLNNAAIKSKQRDKQENVEIITEVTGFDHDNNKAAIIRQTYTIGKSNYTFKKEVQLDGQTDWLERQEFVYSRKPCGDKNSKTGINK